MIERGQHLRLAAEPYQPIGIVGEPFGKNLQRDVATELGIPRAIHLTHAALAKLRDDFIRPEASAGGQRHGSEMDYRRVRPWDTASRMRTPCRLP
jgi:hypothetical protein